MRTEQIVGVVFAILFFSALPCLIYGGGGKNKPPKRPKWAAAGYLLVGFGMLQFGVLTNYFLAKSARPSITGVISDVSRSGGKSPSSTFTVFTDAGQTFDLRARYTGPKLVNGSRAQVRFVEYDRQILELTMLSGTDQGWVLVESDGPGIGYALVGIGLIFLFSGMKTWP